jgi:O-antigen/teichoic acid export membrane protein
MLSGLGWSFGQQFSIQLVNLIVQIVLARILLPQAFGLIAILQVFVSIGQTLSDGGMTVSLIRSKRVGQKDYSTVFFMNIAISIAVYLCLFILAPFIARFYHQSPLQDILRVYMLGIIIQSFVSVQTTILNKEMNFKIQMKMQIPSLILGGIAGVLLAYLDYGVWSLVWMYLIRSIIWAGQHWMFTTWRPILYFDRKRFSNHFRFGYRITLSALLNSIFENSYNLIIGKWFSTIELGYYNRAYTFRQLPVENISFALNKVTFPMFASIQNDDDRLKNVYRKLMCQVIFWTSPALILLIIIAIPLFRIVFTEKWLPAVPYFQILCVAGILYPLHSYNLNILNVKGRSDLFLRLEVAKKIFVVFGLICALQYGIYGLLYFQIISSFVAFFINTFYSGKLIKYSCWDQLKDIAPAILCSALIGLTVYVLNQIVFRAFIIGDFTIIILDTIVFLFLYATISILIRIPAVDDLKLILFKR